MGIDRYGVCELDAGKASPAPFRQSEESTVRRWRTTPRSEQYLPMTEQEFNRFEAKLERYLERG